MQIRAVLVAAIVALRTGGAAAHDEATHVIQSACPALNEDPERLAAFEARALAELALRNPAIERVVVTCNEGEAEVRLHPRVGLPRRRKLSAPPNRQQLVDDLLAAVWDLAPEPRIVLALPSLRRDPLPPPPAKTFPSRLFILGRLGGEAWSGPIHGLWGADVGGGWARAGWSASAAFGFRRPLEVPADFRLTGIGMALAAQVRVLGPLALGATAQLWRTSVGAAAALPRQQVAWFATMGPALRANVELGRLEVSVGPELLFRLPALEIRLDAQEIARLPSLAGGATFELRFRP